jgi:hypothetical protein
MLTVAIYIKDDVSLQYNRIDLFDDEKISVVSSIQNINDISKTTTDYSKTFTIPASVQNNKIFRHWYDNSNDTPFSTLVKSDAYIEIDTVFFRSGKIQLESANLIDGQPQNYSITFIGILGNLKDTFAGKYLSDLTSTEFDFVYNENAVLSRVVDAHAPALNVMFPLISSSRLWNYGNTSDSANNISLIGSAIRFTELFPALRLTSVLSMIQSEFGINFNGTAIDPSTFLSDKKFTNAYLYMKNADTFVTTKQKYKVDFTSNQSRTNYGNIYIDLATDRTVIGLPVPNIGSYSFNNRNFVFVITPNVSGVEYSFTVTKNGILWYQSYTYISVANDPENSNTVYGYGNYASSDYYELYVDTSAPMSFSAYMRVQYQYLQTGGTLGTTDYHYSYASNQSTPTYSLPIAKYFPNIKIEDFFSGLLKMFNLTCYSKDGINYTLETLENYYLAGTDVDITQYILQDKKDLNRVKTYKRINFEYEKSESFINVAFKSTFDVEYGTLQYVNDPVSDGEEYTIKLPFEDLNFSSLVANDDFQVGYCLKTDYQKYITKPIILYVYTENAVQTVPQWYSNSSVSGGSGYPRTTYRAFGQETLIDGVTYGLNFPTQQSTLTNEVIENGLYKIYYENYIGNIFNPKARLIKVSAILPTSVLTSLKLNDNVIIYDIKYLINTFTTDLTTREVQFELLTDTRL